MMLSQGVAMSKRKRDRKSPFNALGLWEIRFEVGRQPTAGRAAACGFGGILFILIG
jgi:hypothetical protein